MTQNNTKIIKKIFFQLKILEFREIEKFSTIWDSQSSLTIFFTYTNSLVGISDPTKWFSAIAYTVQSITFIVSLTYANESFAWIFFIDLPAFTTDLSNINILLLSISRCSLTHPLIGFCVIA